MTTSHTSDAALRRRRLSTAGFHAGAGALSLLWLLPIALVLVTSLRSFDDIAAHGLGSWPQSFTLGNFRQAWVDGGQQRALINSLLVTVPCVLVTLALAAMAAFGLSRYEMPFRRSLLLLMLGGNLLPPQILLIPVSKLSELMGLYDTLPALIGVQIGFGVGFYVFVLHGFMRSIPAEIQQAAVVDGASPWQIFWRIILPSPAPPSPRSVPCPSPGSSTTCCGRSPSCAPTPGCPSPRPSSDSRGSTCPCGT